MYLILKQSTNVINILYPHDVSNLKKILFIYNSIFMLYIRLYICIFSNDILVSNLIRAVSRDIGVKLASFGR